MSDRLFVVAALFLILMLVRIWFQIRFKNALAGTASQCAGNVPLLVAVVSQYCRLCPAQKQVLEQLAQQLPGMFRLEVLDAEVDAERVCRLGIMTVPTTLLFGVDGILVHANSGVASLGTLETQIAGLSSRRDT